MNVTLKDLWGGSQALGKLGRMHFKAKVAYRILKIVNQANKELELFSKVRMELFEKYGAPQLDEEGNETGALTIKSENVEAFEAEMDELASQTVDLKFTVTLDDIADADLTPGDIADLEFLFQEE